MFSITATATIRTDHWNQLQCNHCYHIQHDSTIYKPRQRNLGTQKPFHGKVFTQKDTTSLYSTVLSLYSTAIWYQTGWVLWWNDLLMFCVLKWCWPLTNVACISSDITVYLPDSHQPVLTCPQIASRIVKNIRTYKVQFTAPVRHTHDGKLLGNFTQVSHYVSMRIIVRARPCKHI